MIRRIGVLGLLCVALVGLVLIAERGAAQDKQKTPLRIEDLYLFDAPKTPVLFPDGKRAVYIRNWIDPKTKEERNSLWIVEGSKDKARPMELGEPDARNPVVSPDGNWIAFLSTRPRPKGWKQIPPTPKASDPATDIWIIPATGGAAMPLADASKPYGRVFHDGFYGRVAFSPDGKKLVFVADDGVDPRTKQEIENGVRIVRPDQGEGYTGYETAQVWVATLGTRTEEAMAVRIERLTNDDVWYGDPQWSPDGKTIAVHANKTNERESVRFSINRNFDIWTIDVATKKQTALTPNQSGPEVSPRWSPDGKRIACLTIPRQGSHRDVFNLQVITFENDALRRDVLFDHHAGVPAPLHHPPSFPLPEDCWLDAKNVYYNAESGVVSLRVRADLKAWQGVSLRDTDLPLQRQDQHAQLRSLIPAGNVFLRDRVQAQSRTVYWQNGEGHRLEGILTLPPDSVAQPPYKLIVYPHGGPHSRSALGFDFTVQIFAAHGYAVFQPNFRGSSGYGQKFIDAAKGNLGEANLCDILTGIAEIAYDDAEPKRRRQIIDARQQFLYGTSYGGYMTCWLVGHTRQFRAAVAQNAVTDLHMMWGLSDLQSWVEWEFGGSPSQIPSALRSHSPLHHAHKVETPTLILHSRDDRRCPLPMGQAYYQALLKRGAPTQMVIYPDEGHGIRQPRHREDVLRRVLAWFAKYDR